MGRNRDDFTIAVVDLSRHHKASRPHSTFVTCRPLSQQYCIGRDCCPLDTCQTRRDTPPGRSNSEVQPRMFRILGRGPGGELSCQRLTHLSTEARPGSSAPVSSSACTLRQGVQRWCPCGRPSAASLFVLLDTRCLSGCRTMRVDCATGATRTSLPRNRSPAAPSR